MAMVTVSVGNGNFTADPAGSPAVGGSGPEYTLTWATAVGASLEVGDMWEDNGSPGDLYLVTAISADRKVITVRDQVVPNAPISTFGGTNDFSRAFTSLAAAEAATSTWVVSGDLHILECHKEGAMPLVEAPVAFSDLTLGSTGTLNITVANGEWHQGVPGSGFQHQQNVAGQGLRFVNPSASCPTQIIERLEIVGITVTSGFTAALIVDEDGTNQTTIRNCIVHDYVSSGGSSPSVYGIYVNNSADNGVKVQNCLVYSFTRAGGSGGTARGFRTDGTDTEFDNCTAYNCVQGMQHNGTDGIAKNCVSMGNVGDDYLGTWHVSSTNNASSDTTAPGTNAKKSLAASSQFISVTSGSEDFHLLVGADLIEAGVDLSTDFTDDLDGHDRITPWDIGADGIPLLTQMAMTHRFISAGVHRRVH